MRRIQFALLILSAWVFLSSASLAQAPGNAGSSDPCYRYRDLLPQFWPLLEGKDNTSPTVAQFQRSVITPNHEVFEAVAEPWLTDEGITEFLRRLNGKTAQMRDAERQFPERMRTAWQAFQSKVPGLSCDATVFLVPAPRSAVGGSVRPLKTVNALIIGAEEASTVTGSQLAFNVLFQHELTHLYHIQVNPEMRQMTREVYMPPFASKSRLYQVLWLEGLAAYMSKALNPSSSDEQVFLSSTVAADVRAHWKWLAADLLGKLDSSEKSAIDAYMFDADQTGKIPRRAGYYIGSLIAAELAKKHSFSELCRLQANDLQSAVRQSLQNLQSSPDLNGPAR